MDPLSFRLVGPFRGGRVVAVAGDPVNPSTFYFGGAAGGVFKTTDAGTTWRNVSDGYFRTASVGALAVSPSHPRVLYVGTGESCIRGNVSHGDGVYRSLDGGATWEHRGLADTRHIARVRIHPENPEIVYVAAFGHAFGEHSDRGIFRTMNGGQTWEQVLHVDNRTGAIDLSMDPGNPAVMYAALWQARRYPWSLVSGGPGSGLYQTTDGGHSWVCLNDRPGLPSGVKGRIGVAISPSRPQRVWAAIEAEQGGLFRSDDGGKFWERVSDNPDLSQRPWYYMHVMAHPTDPERVYVLNLAAWQSYDGGKTFRPVPTPHGDNHDLWIDAQNPERMIEGNDGGATVSLDGGRTWSSVMNQPTAQFYHVTTDHQVPWRIYGAQQDNSTLSVPAWSDHGSISMAECYPVGGGESGYIAVRPDRPAIVFAGSYASRMTRYNHQSQQEIDITVWPEDPIGYGAGDLRYRFQWTFPILLSPHDPRCLYAAGNRLFRTYDEGVNWETVSPDLTRGEPSTLASSGGPITQDNVSTEYYGTIFALAESPLTPGVLWAGSDDGLIHVSRDGGSHWTPANVAGLPEWALISIIEASPHDAATAYVAATRYKLDDPSPYLFKTHDYGRTWTLITRGIPADDFTRTIREDPTQPGLLYSGTETGLYVSWDEGEHWERIAGNLPVVPVHDLTVHDASLVIATHGRAFWVLDDLTPVRQWTPALDQEGCHLFPPLPACHRSEGRQQQPSRDTIGYKAYVRTGAGMELGLVVPSDHGPAAAPRTQLLTAGENPPSGLTVWYRLKDPADQVTLQFYDATGHLIREWSSSETGGPTTSPGLNRFVWNLRWPDATTLDTGTLSAYWGGSTVGPVTVPGDYVVSLTALGHTATAPFRIVKDPRVEATTEDLQAQFELLMEIRNTLTAVHDGVRRLRRVRGDIESWQRRLSETHATIADRAGHLADRLSQIENELVEARSRGRADSFNYPPKVNSKLASLQSTVSYGQARPARQCYEVYRRLAETAHAQLDALERVLESDLGSLNRDILQLALPPIPSGH